MCGIVGAVSNRNIVPILLEGLKRLEYRGYDSCGVAVHQGGELRRARSTSRVAELELSVAADGIQATTGIAHTRWATHGAPAVHNAHPHFSSGPGPAPAAKDAAKDTAKEAAKEAVSGRIALVHNGIIENHDELRAELRQRGYVFTSQTDTEVIAHLVHSQYDGDLLDAVQRSLPRLRGAYAIAVFCRDEPLRVAVATRTGLPVVTEVVDPADVPLVAEYADMLQIGTRNMQNFPLLQAVGGASKPVMLKRGLSATYEEWLMAAEYVAQRGNLDIVLCERGIRTFETATRNTLDVSAVPMLHALSHLPVVVDPSHSAGKRDLVVPLTRAAIAVGADAVMVDVHPDPTAALCDGPQALYGDALAELATACRELPPMLGRRVAGRPAHR